MVKKYQERNRSADRKKVKSIALENKLNNGTWTEEEQSLFLQAVKKYDDRKNKYSKMSKFIKTRSRRQVASHYQKWALRTKRSDPSDGLENKNFAQNKEPETKTSIDGSNSERWQKDKAERVGEGVEVDKWIEVKTVAEFPQSQHEISPISWNQSNSLLFFSPQTPQYEMFNGEQWLEIERQMAEPDEFHEEDPAVSPMKLGHAGW